MTGIIDLVGTNHTSGVLGRLLFELFYQNCILSQYADTYYGKIYDMESNEQHSLSRYQLFIILLLENFGGS